MAVIIDFDDGNSSFEKCFTQALILEVEKAIDVEYAFLDDSFHQWYVIGDLLIEASLMAILEVRKFQDFMNSICLENGPIFLSFSSDGNAFKTMMNDHLTNIRDQIQYWVDRKPKGVCRHKMSWYMKQLSPSNLRQTDSLKDWILVMSNQLKSDALIKFSTDLKKFYEEKVDIPFFDDILQ